MTWKRTWRDNRNKELPNILRYKPTIAFRSNLSPDVLGLIKKLAVHKKKAEFINQAIEMRYYFSISKEKFISKLIEENFQLTKHLLRKEGSRRKALTGE